MRVVIGCTGAAFREIVEGQQWQTSVTAIDERPTFETFFTTVRDFTVDRAGPINSPRPGAPTICIIDSGVALGNPFIAAVSRPDLSYSFLAGRPDDKADETGHGSASASLASYYALNLAAGAENLGRFWIASARILDEHDHCPDRLLSAVIREVVSTLAPLGVRIFNLSVNVLGRAWNVVNRRIYPKRSWVARTIDQLTRDADVVFVISTGNLSMDTVRSLSDVRPYPLYLADEQCSLLDPGQASLALTVGSLAATTQLVGQAANSRAIAVRNQPSPFTRRGPGIRGEFKPELVEFGGNLARHQDGTIERNAGCSVIVASNALAPPISWDVGTSLSAPKVSHQIAIILEDLRTLGIEPQAALLKAFAVNSAMYPSEDDAVEAFDQAVRGIEGFDWRNIYGYGVSSSDRATYCDDFTTILYYQGELEHDIVAFLDIPVPVALVDIPRQDKVLTVTVVYHPEVHLRRLSDYVGTSLRWRVFRGDTSKEDVMATMSSDADIEDARELPNAAHGIQKRSKGCVQHDAFVWRDHRAEFSANNYTLAITTFERWGLGNRDPVPFAVVVKLEERSRTVPIYNWIEAELAERVAVHARAHT